MLDEYQQRFTFPDCRGCVFAVEITKRPLIFIIVKYDDKTALLILVWKIFLRFRSCLLLFFYIAVDFLFLVGLMRCMSGEKSHKSPEKTTLKDYSGLFFDDLTQSLLDSLPIGLIIFDCRLKIISHTRPVEIFFRLTEKIDQVLSNGTEAKVWGDWRKLLQDVLARGQTARFGTVRYRREDDGIVLLNMVCTAIKEAGQGRVMGGAMIFEDITEKVGLEQELAQAERLTAIGKVAGKVAHELNNPIDGILRYINLSLRVLEQGNTDKAKEYLGQCRTGLSRMVGIISELLEFSRIGINATESAPLDRILSEAIESMSGALREIDVQVEKRFEGPALQVRGDSIFQVFSNLIKNAADAMNGRGRLNISISKDGREWQIAFTDSGPGVPEQLRDSIFQPFFTTKPAGRGSGLGLAICRDIIEKFRGRITVSHARPNGSVFTVHLPGDTAAGRKDINI
jgi:signal transduction histidine kinase